MPLTLPLISTMNMKLMVVLHTISFVAHGNINALFIMPVEVPIPEEVVKAGGRSRTCEEGVDTKDNDSSEDNETHNMMTEKRREEKVMNM